MPTRSSKRPVAQSGWKLPTGPSPPRLSADWLVDIYDTATGAILSTIDADQDAVTGDITFTLPDFTGSRAFKVYPVGPLTVDIDVIPGGAQNRINISTPAPVFIPVDIPSTPDLDAGTVDPTTVRFGPPGAAGAPPRSYSFIDVDADGDTDVLRLRFRKSRTGFACGDTEGGIRGATVPGRSIEGSDVVTIVANPPCSQETRPIPQHVVGRRSYQHLTASALSDGFEQHLLRFRIRPRRFHLRRAPTRLRTHLRATPRRARPDHPRLFLVRSSCRHCRGDASSIIRTTQRYPQHHRRGA